MSAKWAEWLDYKKAEQEVAHQLADDLRGALRAFSVPEIASLRLERQILNARVADLEQQLQAACGLAFDWGLAS